MRERSDVQVYGYGSRDSVRINSDATIVQEIWLQSRNGSDCCVKLSNLNIEASRGYTVTIVCAYPANVTATIIFCRNLHAWSNLVVC